MLSKAKNESGMSLVEILTVSGILGGLALAVSQMMQMGVKGQKTAETGMAKIGLQQQLMKYQASRDNCELNLGTKTFPQSPSSMTEYKTAPAGNYQIITNTGNINFLTVNGDVDTGLSAHKWKYLGYSLQNGGAFSGPLGAGSSGAVNIVYKFRKSATDPGYGPKDVTIKVPTVVNAADAGPGEYRITGCEATNSLITTNLICTMFGGTLVDNAPVGDGPEDMCTKIAGYTTVGDQAPNIYNVSIGPDALTAVAASGQGNVGIGHSAGAAITTGSSNVIIGQGAGSRITTGAQNVILGMGAGADPGPLFNGSRNVIIGANAGHNMTGNENIIIGYDVDPPTAGDGYMKIGKYFEGIPVYGTDGNGLLRILEPVSAEGLIVTGPTSLFSLNVTNTATFQQAVTFGNTTDFGNTARFSQQADFSNNIKVSNILPGTTYSPTTVSIGIKSGDPGGPVASDLSVSRNLFVIGDAWKTANNTWGIISDRRLKNVKGKFTRGLESIMGLDPVIYKLKKEKTGKSYIGVIAQEVKPFIPEAISLDESGHYKFFLDPVFWTLVNATKEQQVLIEKQNKKIEALEDAVAELREEIRRIKQNDVR